MISVVVPNHGRDITRLKDSVLSASEYINTELIVIDAGLERSEQRNIGIKQSKRDIILWLDSDQAVSKGLLVECVIKIAEGADSLYIPEIIVADSFFGKIRAFERSFLTGTAVDVPRAVLRSVCPLFDTDFNGPEDADFGNRIPGNRGVTESVLYHHDDISLLEYIKKKAYYTKSMKKYAEKWPDDPCLRLRYRCFTVFTENGKWKKLLKHPILTAGVILLLILRGVIYARR